MELEVIELSDTYARFVMSDVSTAFANALRRIMIAEVPKIAIDEVNIYENTSVVYDEQLALRLGLIPLKTDLESYVLRSECKCENGCPSCQVSLTLSVEGPKVVYSSDLVSSDKKIVPAHGKIPIVKLTEGQKLVLEAIARLELGREHAKWQTVVACGYKNMPKVKVADSCNACGKCADACPRGVFLMKEKAVVKNQIDCSFCMLCEKECGVGAIKVEKDRRAFVFTFETDGSLPAKEVLTIAAEALGEKAKKFKESLEKNA